MRGSDSQCVQCLQHSRSLHGRAVVGVEHQGLGGQALLRQARTTNQLAGVLSRLFLPDLPANDITAENVHNQVEEIEQALHRSSQVGDVPGPDLVWSCCAVGGRLSVLARHLSPAAMILHFFFMKNAVNGGFRGKIDPFVGENGHNLTGRHTGKAFFVHRFENRLALLCAEFIGGIGVICKPPSILVGPVLFVECLPAIVRPLSDA